MDETQLRAALAQLGVTPPDVPRAALYLDLLTATQTFLTQTLANTLGARYAFVQAAVSSGGLLEELAESLDLYVGPAVDGDLRLAFAADAQLTYATYFSTRILGDSYQANLQQFRQRFPITALALTRLAANFQTNIQTACTRITGDVAAIQQLFADTHPGLVLLSLKAIRSTGSDFHKGGQQVLILTFASSYWWGKIPWWSDFQLVYKPGDLEEDCLLVGDSAAVNRASPGFMTESLAEIFNALAAQAKLADPTSTLEPLRTYRILPRNHTSTHPANTYPVPLRNAYGYIQYLGYEYQPGRLQVRGYDPFGTSDYVIFRSQDEAPVIRGFYRQMGQLAALASTFSLTDLHVENVRVNAYAPLLIDLEISLTLPIADVEATVLFGPNGGVTGREIRTQEFTWAVDNAGVPGKALLNRRYRNVTYQNRLVALRPQQRLVPPNAFWLLEGFENGMKLLGTGAAANRFDAWFGRVANVLVRYLPYATPTFKSIRSQVFFNGPMDAANYGQQPLAVVRARLLDLLTDELERYQNAPTPEPDFIVLQHPQVEADYMNLDIPVFYHRVGSTTIVDSAGAAVPVPDAVTVRDPNDPGATLAVPLNLPPQFFAAPPTAAVVRAAQVQPLGAAATRQTRINALKATLIEALGLQAAPANPGALLG